MGVKFYSKGLHQILRRQQRVVVLSSMIKDMDQPVCGVIVGSKPENENYSILLDDDWDVDRFDKYVVVHRAHISPISLAHDELLQRYIVPN